MKISSYTNLSLFFGLLLSLAVALPADRSAAAESIKGTYVFKGTAKAKGPDGNPSTKKFKGKMRVARKSVTLQIPISVDGKVKSCQKTVRARLNKGLQRNPSRASRRATFTNAACQDGNKWSGTLRLKWLEHPEGYAMSFSIGGINDDDVDVQKITGKFKGSTGTLSTADNQPEVPEVPVVDDHG